MKLKKNVIIILIVIFIIAIIIGIFFYKKSTSVKNDTIKEKAYIDIWKYRSMSHMDFEVYSIGSGDDEKLYLGEQTIHYLINKKGEVNKYQASSYKNKKTGKRDPAKVEYIKTLSKSELENLKNDLNSIIESCSNSSVILDSSYWYIKINGNSTLVNNDVKNNILNKYW